MLTVHLLGDFRIELDGRQLPSFHAERVRTLLAYLLLHRHAPLPRHQVAFTLWPDTSDSQARSNLRNLLHTFRQALPDADTYLAVDNLTIQWRADAPYQLDVAEFEDALADADASPDTAAAIPHLTRAVARYTGDLLPAHYDDWLDPQRADLRNRYEAALHALVTRLEAHGDFAAALQHADRRLHHDPLSEAAYVQLMRLHARLGDRAGVSRVYAQCVDILARELDDEPSPATRAAHEEYLRAAAHVVHPTDAPVVTGPATGPVPRPASMPGVTPQPLPTPGTPFIGRDAELHALDGLLADPACRLLTIVGPGGMGKTRLALEAAGRAVARGADIAAFVPLAAVRDQQYSAAAIAQALNVSLHGAAAPEAQLFAALRDVKLLLVLDNMEQLLDGVDLLSDLLAHAPAVKILATSRERLNLQEEWVYLLEGLEVLASASAADPAGSEGQGHVPDAPAGMSEAAALFVQCARRTRSNFVPTAEDIDAIDAICALVDGMPLGIELAAAWVRMLTCPEIAREIERNLDFLATPARNVPARHRTLRAVFDQSWAMLQAHEQQVLRRLSVFQGGCTLTMATDVTDADLLTLAALTDKSLVQFQPRPAATPRYRLHNRVRQYANRQLHAAGEAHSVRDRHLFAYLKLAEDAAPRLEQEARAEQLALLEEEHDNLRAALAWGLGGEGQETDEAPTMHEARRLAGVRLAAALGRFWQLHAHFREGYAWLHEAIASAASMGALPPDVSARLRYAAGDLAGFLERFQLAQEHLQAGLALERATGNIPGLIRTLHRLAELASGMGDTQRFVAWADEALTLARTLDDPWLLARSLAVMTTALADHGELDRAAETGAESLARVRLLRNGQAPIYLLNVLGQLATARNEHAQALALLTEALERARRESHGREGEAWTLRNLGLARHLQGDLDGATADFRASLAMRHAAGQSIGVAWALEGLAGVAVSAGDWARAARLWGAAARLRHAGDSSMSPADQARFDAWYARARISLGDAALKIAWDTGQAMDLDAAVCEATQA